MPTVNVTYARKHKLSPDALERCADWNEDCAVDAANRAYNLHECAKTDYEQQQAARLAATADRFYQQACDLRKVVAALRKPRASKPKVKAV